MGRARDTVSSMKRRRELSRRLRAWMRAVAAFALAAVVLGTAVLAGRTYLWCVAMDRPMPDCCCRQVLGRSEAPRQGPAVERHLFDYRTIAGVGQPVAPARDARPAPSAAAFVVIAPDVPRIPAQIRAERTPNLRRTARPRSGADPPPPQRARALLQVYRC